MFEGVVILLAATVALIAIWYTVVRIVSRTLMKGLEAVFPQLFTD